MGDFTPTGDFGVVSKILGSLDTKDTSTSNLPSYAKPGPYVTKLSKNDETSFQSWVKSNKIPWEDTPDADYDMRGFYKAMMSGDKEAVRSRKNNHFPDTYKTPYHKTFSNESKYATKDAPHWEGDKLVDSKGNVLVDESQSNK